MAKATSSKETVGLYNLVLGEDSYSGQNAQNPMTARRLQSLIPSISGELVRELGEPTYLPTNLGSKVGALHQYDYNDSSGNQLTKRFAATSTQLFMEVAGAWVVQSLPLTTGLSSTSALVDYPQFEIINNLLHFSDGGNNWIYDGPNNQFVLDGFPIPPQPFGVGLPSTAAGVINATIGLYYWATYADQTTGRVHESSSSVISAISSPLAAQSQNLQIMTDTVDTTIGDKHVVSHNGFSPWSAPMVGMILYVNGVNLGPIATFTDANHIILVNNAPATVAAGFQLVVPLRTTHVHIYRSESDGSKLGKFLTSIAVTANPPTFNDNSPLQNQPGSTMLNIDRPIRNDPAPASKIIAAHKYRLWRRREKIPNRFTYTANEEVLSGNNGSPQESVPGTDPLTISDRINETAYPNPASSIRAIKRHGDALYFGTEKEIIPLWGDTIGQFALSAVTAVDGGVISRWGLESLSHGLSIFSYDRKLYIYPPVSPIYSITPQDINVTDQLIEIGRPMRNKFLTLLASDIQNVRTLKYRYNSRDWLVVAYQDNTNIYHTYIYDFETKGWFELQRGFVSLAVFETSPGVKILVGGGTDGLVYVVDDLTGAISNSLPFPTGLFRTALINFGKPDYFHIPEYLEMEVNNPVLMDSTVTVNFYLDPTNADSPGTPFQLDMAPVQNQPNIYRGFFAKSGGGMGVVCKRFMVEINLTSDSNSGTFRGILIKAEPKTNLMM